MKHQSIILLLLLSIFNYPFSILNSSAAVPLRWTVETSRLQPAVFDVVRGETLDLEASFKSYGTPVATSNLTAFLCWQTNGMASAWWVTNAVTTASVARVLFTPEMDPGAPNVNAFIGLSDSTNQQPNYQLPANQLPSLSYRAAFTLRFRHGPGAAPNVISAPVPILDLANTVVVNPPWTTKADFAATTTVMRAELKDYVDEQIEGAGLVTPQTVTNISGCVTSNVVTKSFVEGLGISTGIDTNAVQSIINLNVETNLLFTVASVQEMTNGLLRTSGGSLSGDLTLDGYLHGEIEIPRSRSIVFKSPYGQTHEMYYDFEGDFLVIPDILIDWTDLISHPDTVLGYGISDAYTKTQIDGNTVTNGGAKAYADASFRTKTDNVCHTNQFTSWTTHVQDGWFVVEGPYHSDTEIYPNCWFLWIMSDDATASDFLTAEYNENATYINFGSGNESFRSKVSTSGQPFVTADNVPTTNGLVTASVTNGLESASHASSTYQPIGDYATTQAATNAAVAVVGDVMEYGLTNITANTETFSIASGVIGNLSLDNAHTNINLTLLYPASDAKSADILIRVINAADTALAINSADTDVDGTDWTKVKAGTNYVSATRTAYEGGRSKVLVSIKEVK